MATQLTEQQFARRLAYVASLSLPDSIVKEAINRLADVNGFAKSKDAAAALNGRTPARRGAAVLTGVKDAVLRALSAIQGEFTYHEVERELERMKYDFQALNRVSSIGRVLRGLRKQGTLTLVRKGKAGETNVFRKATP